MPLVDMTYAPTVPEPLLRAVGAALPHRVSPAAECPEEPYDGDLQPGDVEIRGVSQWTSAACRGWCGRGRSGSGGGRPRHAAGPLPGS